MSEKNELQIHNVQEKINIKPYEHRARYYETDQMGVIHHSNYIKWMEEARMDMLDQLGLGYKQMEAMEIVTPILSISIDYLSMVHFDDIIIIETEITAYDGSKMEIKYTMYDEKTGDEKAVATSSHCFMNKSGRPISMKRIYPELDTKFFEFK